MATWLITGCSSGLGKNIAEAVLAQGDSAMITARDVSSLADLAARYPDAAYARAMDVTCDEQVASAVSAAEDRFGSIDVLVNNAGYGYRAAVEEGEDAAVGRLFDTLFFGPVRTIKAVLPGMRARRAGTIVNVSSIGARLSPAGSGYYAGAKAALEAMTLSLRREVAPLGIRAVTIEPGGLRTDFGGRSLTQVATPISDYAETAGLRRIENDRVHGSQIGDPTKAAAAIIEVVESSAPPFLFVLGSDAVAGFDETAQQLRSDVRKWKNLSCSTDFDSSHSPK